MSFPFKEIIYHNYYLDKIKASGLMKCPLSIEVAVFVFEF